MALELQKTTQYNIGVIVSNAVSAVRTVRAQESTRKEAEFQKAVAEGMTYEEQVKYREEQITKEKEGGFIDAEYISELEGALATAKQMVRFDKIRTKYKEALDDYVAGKESLDSYIDLLNETMTTEKDETMRTELRSLISQATQEKATNELNAIKNRALVAQKDNSARLITKSISEIKSRRARASIAENDDEVAMWDETLIALEQSQAKLSIEDSLNEITFKINKFNPKAVDKLGYINEEIAKADDGKEVVYNGVTYPSMKAYWENKRGEYISAGFLDEAKADMDAETARIAAQSPFGQIPTARIAAVNDYYAQLRARPEFASFADVIEQKRVEALSTMTSDLAESIFNEEATTGDRAKAENAILGLESKFGVSVSREPFARELGKGSSIANEALKVPVVAGAPSAPGAGGSYTVMAGDNLSKIAARNGMSLLQLLDANPEYKANPGMVRAGATIKLPTGASTITPPKDPTAPVAPVTPEPIPSRKEEPAPKNEPIKPATTPTVTPPKPLAPTVTPPKVTAPTPTPTNEYVVVAGDTLSAIALKSGKSVKELAASNAIADPNKIKVGQKIKL